MPSLFLGSNFSDIPRVRRNCLSSEYKTRRLSAGFGRPPPPLRDPFRGTKPAALGWNPASRAPLPALGLYPLRPAGLAADGGASCLSLFILLGQREEERAQPAGHPGASGVPGSPTRPLGPQPAGCLQGLSELLWSAAAASAAVSLSAGRFPGSPSSTRCRTSATAAQPCCRLAPSISKILWDIV